MSKIVSPIPPLEKDDLIVPAEASWWRLQLPTNDDKILYYQRTDGSLPDATWAEVEFFDGETTILDAGLDTPNVWGIVLQNFPPSSRTWLELLCVGPPTPNPDWKPLTEPGNHIHPDDAREGQRR